ncbi:hypothetical protein IWX91DRAFT_395957 [Phyllosticta citricarpa]
MLMCSTESGDHGKHQLRGVLLYLAVYPWASDDLPDLSGELPRMRADHGKRRRLRPNRLGELRYLRLRATQLTIFPHCRQSAQIPTRRVIQTPHPRRSLKITQSHASIDVSKTAAAVAFDFFIETSGASLHDNHNLQITPPTPNIYPSNPGPRTCKDISSQQPSPPGRPVEPTSHACPPHPPTRQPDPHSHPDHMSTRPSGTLNKVADFSA